jgi:sec-independent protein translocase protein TatA
MNIGWGELLVILVIVLLITGPRRLPDVGRSLGVAIRAFQDALRGKSDDKPRPPDRPASSGGPPSA